SGPDWHQTTIMVEDLRVWLRARGIKTGFFFPAPEVSPDYLSEFHPSYSAKLAAAIEAWKAVSGDTELRRGKSVKQALIVGLRQHANEFGLTKEDGNANEQGIEDVAKIANWDTKGGAPKTPGSERLPSRAAAIRPPIASDARRRGSASRCAYRCVVDACVCPN